MKKILSIIFFIFLSLVILVLARNTIIKTTFSATVKAITGLTLEIKSMDIGLFKSAVAVKDLKIFNPPGFEEQLMVNMPEIYIDYDLDALLNKKIHLQEVRIHLKEFIVVKNKEGKLNLDSLKAVQASKEEKKPKEEKTKTEMPSVKIDILLLKIGKVIYKDYYEKDKPLVREFNVNIDERYENITDPQKVVSLIIVKALARTSIASLSKFDLKPLSEGVGGILKDTTGMVKGLGLEAANKTTETVKKTTDILKKILPFSGKK